MWKIQSLALNITPSACHVLYLLRAFSTALLFQILCKGSQFCPPSSLILILLPWKNIQGTSVNLSYQPTSFYSRQLHNFLLSETLLSASVWPPFYAVLSNYVPSLYSPPTFDFAVKICAYKRWLSRTIVSIYVRRLRVLRSSGLRTLSIEKRLAFLSQRPDTPVTHTLSLFLTVSTFASSVSASLKGSPKTGVASVWIKQSDAPGILS